jgi:hypothetical protein
MRQCVRLAVAGSLFALASASAGLAAEPGAAAPRRLPQAVSEQDVEQLVQAVLQQAQQMQQQDLAAAQLDDLELQG